MEIIEVEQRVLSIITEKKVKMKDLAELVGCNARTIRLAINRLINKGHPISNIGGYSIIRSQEELERVIRVQRKRAMSSLRRYNQIKKQPLHGQEKLL